MARAPLPREIPTRFFVLRWDPELEDMVIHVDDPKRSSYSLGNYLPQAIRQLTWWGIPLDLATRAVDAAREFRKVQVIPSQDRIINLIPRTSSKDAVADMLRDVESAQASQPFVSL